MVIVLFSSLHASGEERYRAAMSVLLLSENSADGISGGVGSNKSRKVWIKSSKDRSSRNGKTKTFKHLLLAAAPLERNFASERSQWARNSSATFDEESIEVGNPQKRLNLSFTGRYGPLRYRFNLGLLY